MSAFFDFCAGNRHQILAGAWVKAVKVTPKLLVARLQVAIVGSTNRAFMQVSYHFILNSLYRVKLQITDLQTAQLIYKN